MHYRYFAFVGALLCLWNGCADEGPALAAKLKPVASTAETLSAQCSTWRTQRPWRQCHARGRTYKDFGLLPTDPSAWSVRPRHAWAKRIDSGNLRYELGDDSSIGGVALSTVLARAGGPVVELGAWVQTLNQTYRAWCERPAEDCTRLRVGKDCRSTCATDPSAVSCIQCQRGDPCAKRNLDRMSLRLKIIVNRPAACVEEAIGVDAEGTAAILVQTFPGQTSLRLAVRGDRASRQFGEAIADAPGFFTGFLKCDAVHLSDAHVACTQRSESGDKAVHAFHLDVVGGVRFASTPEGQEIASQ